MTYETVETPSPAQLDDLVDLYRSYPWWEERDRDDVRRAVEATDLFVGLADPETGELVAAARVLTDFTYYGKIFDVIVDEARRRDGLGRRVMDAILEHESLRRVEVLTLHCREGLVPFYEDCGFERHEMTVPVDDGEEELVRMRNDQR
ncbi:GNAT family N-acetyltransferase [Halovivax limisalsi]|uniref:GNAT family N-acetyltransferase n=1 Tax=Halovivax limisalsi TaxID=1453760 RepID=UPI001FFDAE98|nr:GNAT family N-acetyltransferase [Halovivax limisalsi]